MDLNKSNKVNSDTFVLTDDQAKALLSLTKFINIPFDKNNVDTYLATLSGYAGTGKTFLTQMLLDVSTKYSGVQSLGSPRKIAAAAPTHKAKKILNSFINSKTFINIPIFTVASLLYKKRKHTYIGTKSFGGGSGFKISLFKLILIDEVSMVSDKDFDDIKKYACLFGTKIIFIGDNAQIPNPSQAFETDEDGYLIKKISKAFSINNVYQLNQIIRQDSGNPLIAIYDHIRKNIGKELSLNKFDTKLNEKGEGIIWHHDLATFIRKIQSIYNEHIVTNSYSKIKIIAYTNLRVGQYNKLVRDILKRKSRLEVGEILMGYENLGWPIPIIENGQDYIVEKITPTTNHIIISGNKKFSNLVGDIIEITEMNWLESNQSTDSSEITLELADFGLSKKIVVFVPCIDSRSNLNVFLELVRLANKNNAKYSTKIDFVNYCRLNEKLIFLKNIYRINGNMMTIDDAKHLHPLLFCRVNQVIDVRDGKRTLRSASEQPGFYGKSLNQQSKQINSIYKSLLLNRMNDKKPIVQSERLIDIFQIINKDLDYGYAITSHKSQGSTYEIVFVDEKDFGKTLKIWNGRFNKYEYRIREINQMKYVSFTRPSKLAIVYSQSHFK